MSDFLQGLLKQVLCLPANSAFSPTSPYQVHAGKSLHPLNISNISELKVLNVSVAAELGSLKGFKNTRTNTFQLLYFLQKEHDTLADIDFPPLIHIEFESTRLGFEQKAKF